MDELFLRALDAWLDKLSPELRWKMAIDLYTSGHVSTGRAVQLAGLNTFVFIEELQARHIPFMAPEPATKDEKAEEEALLNELFDFSKI